MKVYVVMAQSGYEDIWVEAVLSSKDRAKVLAEKEGKLWSGVSTWVETWEVNGKKEEED